MHSGSSHALPGCKQPLCEAGLFPPSRLLPLTSYTLQMRNYGSDARGAFPHPPPLMRHSQDNSGNLPGGGDSGLMRQMGFKSGNLHFLGCKEHAFAN